MLKKRENANARWRRRFRTVIWTKTILEENSRECNKVCSKIDAMRERKGERMAWWHFGNIVLLINLQISYLLD